MRRCRPTYDIKVMAREQFLALPGGREFASICEYRGVEFGLEEPED